MGNRFNFEINRDRDRFRNKRPDRFSLNGAGKNNLRDEEYPSDMNKKKKKSNNKFIKNDKNEKLSIATKNVKKSFNLIDQNEKEIDASKTMLQCMCPHVTDGNTFSIKMYGKRDTNYFPMQCKECKYVMNIAPFTEEEYKELETLIRHEFDMTKLVLASTNNNEKAYEEITKMYAQLLNYIEFAHKIIQKYNKANNKKTKKSAYDY